MGEYKFQIGKYKYQVFAEQKNGRVYLSYSYNEALTAELKASFEQLKWHGFDPVPQKKWSFPITHHNAWRFNFYTGNDPYATYDKPLASFTPKRPLKSYQCEMAQFQITYKRCITGAGMGTGKTVTTIEALEALDVKEVYWIAPRSALYSVEVEFDKWKSNLDVNYLTYQGAVKLVDTWTPGRPAPRALVIDESQRVKNITAKQTQACVHLADSMRTEWGDDAVILLLSGTPSPKSPVDWWAQCRIACPGFLREGHYKTFQSRLAFIKQELNQITNTPYPRLVTWWDNSDKCKVCGQLKSDSYHDMAFAFAGGPYHSFVPSTNEVESLYRRLKGLVKIVLKKDVLSELPDKMYRTITCTPSPSTIRAAKLITAMTDRGATALTLLRELSDGFQYEAVQTGTRTCTGCAGTGALEDTEYIGPEVDEFEFPTLADKPEHFRKVTRTCPKCNGTKEEPILVKEPTFTPTPKEKILTDLLKDELADDGRAVIWAGFHGSLDRCLDIVKKCGWHYICVDGRGWRSDIADKPKDMLKAFQDKDRDDKIAFIGHPASGGTGLTLTAASTAIYFSNDFSYEARAQSEDRIHRIGMDTNKGCTIIDIVHLPSDLYVLENLMQKKKLMAITMGDVQTALETMLTGVTGYGVRG